MNYLAAFLATLAFGLHALTVHAAESVISHQLGDTTVHIQVYENGPGLTYVALHDNEDTSVAAARSVVSQHGGRLLELVHTGERNISFTIAGVRYEFDPNRMFTDPGIRATLEAQGEGNYSLEAHLAVRALGAALVIYLNTNAIVAVHNNTDGSYSFESYLPGGSEAQNTRDINPSTTMDRDNFFLVTSQADFELLKRKDYNVVLQSGSPVNDGSLSVYAEMRGMAYINSEAQHGADGIQTMMLMDLAAGR